MSTGVGANELGIEVVKVDDGLEEGSAEVGKEVVKKLSVGSEVVVAELGEEVGRGVVAVVGSGVVTVVGEKVGF